MMYKKKFMVLFILAILVFLNVIPKSAVKSENSWEDAEILIIFNNNPNQEEISGVQTMVKILTYLQHSVVFASVDECIPVLRDYDFIICYDLRNVPDYFVQSLVNAEKAVMMLGGNCAEAYTSQKGYMVEYHWISDSIATVKNSLYAEEPFTSLLKLKDCVLLNGYFSYTTGELDVDGQKSSLYMRVGNFLYTPISDLSEPSMQALFTKEVARWLWPYNGEPHSYAQYIVLDEVYPFVEPQKLMEIVDYLIHYQLPFVISVMPIYQNTEYPAMKRFCEVLRYAQANGGAIILHAPIIQQYGENTELLKKYLSMAKEAYISYGVYPLGIQVPDSYMFIEAQREILKWYSTVFFYKDNDDISINLDERFNYIYKNGHQIIGPAICLGRHGNNQVKTHLTAVYIDIYDGMEKVKEQIHACIQSRISIKSLWNTYNVVYGNNIYLNTDQGQLYYNNNRVSLKYEPFEYEEDFNYKNDVFHWIAKDLRSLNKVLIIVVILSSTTFLAFIIKARHVNKRRFLISSKRR